ncbi:hypothetical protein GCM10010170_071710 [Dactylosporangium salmoneum]|uniref:Uncharacterized protein n=1 Tax=Dactylosporangium salmoneum TaxID=53361 RepID=A0ABP5U8L6_9ACTN
MSTANTICSIGAFTPNPLRADGEVDPESGRDADQVGGEVVHAESDQQLDHDDVDRHRGQAGETEVREPLQRQAAAPEGPHFMQDVVGYEGELDRRHGGRQQREPEQPVQHEQGGVVDDDTADSHQGEPAQPVQVGRHAHNRADGRPPGTSRRGSAGPATFGLPHSA